MHTRELLELATLLAVQGKLLIIGDEPLGPAGLEEYWAASKCRLDRWGNALRRFNDGQRSERPRSDWAELLPLLEQAVASELLTRTWAAVLCGHDRFHGRGDAEPIGRSVLIGHLEARHRVLSLLVHGRGLELALAQSLSILYRRTERWTDLLIGHLVSAFDVSELAFSPERSRRMAAQLTGGSRPRPGRASATFLTFSLRSAFARWLARPEPNVDLHARIAAGILATFPESRFDEVGLPRSPWLTQWQSVVDETPPAAARRSWLTPPDDGAPQTMEGRDHPRRF